jgi:hypothetical protein
MNRRETIDADHTTYVLTGLLLALQKLASAMKVRASALFYVLASVM